MGQSLIRLLSIVCTLGIVITSDAQNGQLELSGPDVTSTSLNISSKIYLDPTRRLSVEDFSEMRFKEYNPDQVTSVMDAQQYEFWQLFEIKSTAQLPFETLLSSRVFKHNFVYEITGNETVFIGKFGLGVPKQSWPLDISYEVFPIELKPRTSRKLVIHSYENKEPTKYYPDIEITNFDVISEKIKTELYTDRRFIITSYFFIGALFLLWAFLTSQYFQLRKKSYLYYSLYIASILIFFNGLNERYPGVNYFYSYFPWLFLKFKFTSYFVFIFYIYFTRHFLNLKNQLPQFNRWLKILTTIIIAVLITHSTLHLFNLAPIFRYLFYYVFRFALEIINISIIVYIFIYHQGKIKYYYCVGSLILILGSFASLLSSVSTYSTNNLVVSFNPIVLTQAGILLEVLIFSAGLGYKAKMLEVEKQETKTNYINQLKRNNELQLKQNVELEEQVRARSKELLDVQSEKLRTEYEGQIMELDSKILLSQMNPHFLFNSLSSIKQYVINHPTRETTQYIGEFANLVRMILQYSRRRWISLSEELEFLKLYAGLEQKRFASEIELEINNNTDLLVEEIELPPMILQPIVENAILHGLRTVKHKGLIKINILSNNEHIMLEVVDNGIGRNAALKLRPSYKKEKPLGTTITLERIEMLNKLYNTNFNMEIIDLYVDKKASGTKVVLTFPK